MTGKATRRRSATPTDPAKHAGCVGYIAGIYDLQFAPTPPRGVCPPPNCTPEILRPVVTAYADTHEDGPAPAAIGAGHRPLLPVRDQEPRRR